jgi:cysteine desulfurase
MSIYMDNAATVPLSDVAADALTTAMRKIGNASSVHNFGRAVRKDVEDAREELARLVGCGPTEVIFTGSGTEANNLAIKGFYWSRRAENPQRTIIVASAFEHHAVLDPIEWLVEHEGAEQVLIPVTAAGVIDIEFLRNFVAANRERIALIAVMHSNNELGTIQPIADVVTIAGDIPVHSDAVQSFGKVPFDFAGLGLTSATISAHKIGGPLGVAALILQRGLDVTPVLHGGGQERDIRSGTINAPAIIAFVAAARDSLKHLADRAAAINELREYLINRISREIPSAHINAASGEHLPGIVNVTFPGTESDAVLLLLDSHDIAASAGSACSAGVPRPSHVLMAMGRSEADADASIRFSLGTINAKADIDILMTVLPDVVAKASKKVSA